MGESRDKQAKDDLLATALANGKTVLSAAEFAGVSESTARRRLRDPGFRDEVESARARRVSEITRLLEESAPRAVQTLVDGLEDDAGGIRLSAARTLLAERRSFLAVESNDVDRQPAVLRRSESDSSPAELAEGLLDGLLERASEALRAGSISAPTFAEVQGLLALNAKFRGHPDRAERVNHLLRFSRTLDIMKDLLPPELFQAVGARLQSDSVIAEIDEAELDRLRRRGGNGSHNGR